MSTADLEGLIQQAATQYGVDPNLLRAHIQQESGGNPNVTSSAGAQGVAQLMPKTARGLGVTNAYDPAQAIPGAAKLIAENMAATHGDVATAILRYHGGPDQSKWGPKTQAYQKAVMAGYQKGGADNADSDFDAVAGVKPSAAVPTDDFDKIAGVTGAPEDHLSKVAGDALTAPGTLAAPSQPTQSGDPFSQLMHKAEASATAMGSPSIARISSGPDEGGPVTQAQQEFYVAHPPDERAPPGSKYNPTADKKDSAVTEHGAWHVGLDGVPKQVPLTAEEQAAYDRISKEYDPKNGLSLKAANGLLPFIGAPAASGAMQQLMSGGFGPKADADAHMRRMVVGERLSEYGRAHPLASALTEDAASLAVGGLLTEGLGAGLNAARVPQALGPIGEFASGQSAASAGPGMGNALLRGASRTTQNALQGAAFGAESAHLNPNEPVQNQILGGSLGGAALGGIATGARMAGRFVGERFPGIPAALQTAARPFSQAAQEGSADRVLQEFAVNGPTTVSANELVPNSAPTLATSTNNAGLMQAERTMRATPAGANLFRGLDEANDKARADFADNFRGNNDTLAAAEAARDARVTPILAKGLQNSTSAEASPVLSKIDEVLQSGATHRNDISGPLNDIRSKLFNDDAGMNAHTRGKYEKSIMSALGSDATRPTQGTLAEAKDRIGSVFDRVAGNTNVNVDDALMARLGEIGGNANKYLTEGEAKPILAHIADIGGAAENGVIPGKTYQALTKSGAPLDGTMGSNNSNVSVPAQQIREALDDALERSANPADLADLKQARNQYRNLKIIQDASNKTAPGEMIEPSALLSSVRKVTPNFAFKGGGELGDAAQSGLTHQATPASLRSNPEHLLGVRDALDSVLRSREAKVGSGHESTAPLVAVRDALDQTLSKSIPGYSDYLEAHAAATKPIDEQRFLLDRPITSADGRVLPGSTNRLLEAISAAQRAPGNVLGKSVSPQTVKALEALKADLVRASLTPDKTAGSPTFANLNGNALLGKLGIPMAVAGLKTGGLTSLAHGVTNALYSGANNKVKQILLEKLANPEYGATAFAPILAPIPAPANPLLSGAAGSYVNHLMDGRRKPGVVVRPSSP